MSIEVKSFGQTKDGKEVKQFIISSGAKSIVSLIEFGAVIQSLWVSDKNGNLRDIVLGYDTVSEYENDSTFFGAALGRLISLMPGNKLVFEDQSYQLNSKNGIHMHGGPNGFSYVKWEGEVIDDSTVRFSYTSPDKEGGYPGTVYASITYTLDDTSLSIKYDMASDRRTIINPSNHSYFNLNGHNGPDISNHYFSCPVECHFDQLTDITWPLDLGIDICSEVCLKDVFSLETPSLKAMQNGIDHKFVLKNAGPDLKDSGYLYSPESGIELKCETTMPCIMIYTGNTINDEKGKHGTIYKKYGGICFETMLSSSYEDKYGCVAVIEPGKSHVSTTKFSFGIKEN